MPTRIFAVLAFMCVGSIVVMRGGDSIAPPGPLSERPTVPEVSHALRDRSLSAFTITTPQNKAAVEGILRRIAARQDYEIAQNVDPGSQADQTTSALSALAATLHNPADLGYFQRFFESYDGTPASVAHESYARAIIEYGAVELSEKERMLRNIASGAMDSYAVFARRMGIDNAAVPALLRKLDHPNYDVAADAARALSELRSVKVVDSLVARLPAEEAKFSRAPWDPKIIEHLQEYGGHDTRFGKAPLYVGVLSMIKVAEGRAAAAAAVDRWEAMYRNHPDRDKYLTWLGVEHKRGELARTAGEVAATEPVSNVTSTDAVTPSASLMPPSQAEVTVPPSTVHQGSSTPSSGFLWTGAGGAIALIAVLLFFWKRRTG